MRNFDAFGLEWDSELTNKLIIETISEHSRFLQGFNYVHLSTRSGDVELVVNGGFDKGGNPVIAGISIHCTGDHIYRMRIEEKVWEHDTEVIYVCSSLSGRGATLPFLTVMGDIIPPLMKGDLITFQGTGIPEGEFCLTLSKDKAIRLFPGNGYIPDDGMILSGARLGSMYNMIFAKVRNLNEVPFIEGHTLYSLEVWSDIGPLTILVPPGYLEKHKGIYNALIKGREVYLVASFYISGDVAVGKYSGGAIYDEESMLRLLRASIHDGRYERLNGFLSRSLVTSGFRYDGSLSKALESLIVPKGRDNEEIRTNIYKVTKVLVPEKAVYGEGKLLLGVESCHFSGAFAIGYTDYAINSISLISENIYEADAGIPAESAEERHLRRRPYYSDSIEGWYDTFASWASGCRDRSLRVFFGLSDDVLIRKGDTILSGREDVYPVLDSYISTTGKKTVEEIKESVSLGISLRGMIKEITINESECQRD